jgi:hypothetical protein
MADSPHPAATAATLRPATDRPLDAEAVRELRRFHRHGGPAAAGAAEAWLPPALAGFRGGTVRSDYPLFLAAGDDGEVVCRPLPALLAELAPPEPRSLADNLLRLERHVRELFAQAQTEADAGQGAAGQGAAVPVDAAPLLAAAAAAMTAEIRLPQADAEGFSTALAALVAAVPVGGVLVPFAPGAPLVLLAAAVAARRRLARAAALPEARSLAESAAAILAADTAAREGRGGPALEASLGALGGRFVKASALAAVGDGRRGGTALAAERRAGLEAAGAALDAFCAPPARPRLFVDRPGAGGGDGWEVAAAADPAAAATAAWDEEAERLLAVVRALHRVRLEAAGDFDPERHEAWLEHLAWEDLGADELALATPIAAIVGPGALLAGGLPSLSRLLLSGRPVQVVVPLEPDRLDAAEGRTGFRFEPAFLGVAHREVFVQQGSAARPELLLDGFRRALAVPRPGLHVVATPPAAPSRAAAGLDPWLVASAAIEARAHPLFVYDPGAGLSWARRLDFRANPEPEADWVTHAVAAGDDAGSAAGRAIPFTAADVLLLSDPAQGRPAGGDAEELVALVDWLGLDPAEASRRLPFVWATDGGGRLERLVVTRQVALATRDRLAFWHLLQELGGVRNEHVDEARRAARREAADAAAVERQRLEAEHAARLEQVRRQAAEEAIDRLVGALFELEAGELSDGAEASVAALGLPSDVDELTAALLAAVRREPGNGSAAGGDAPPADDPRVATLAGELLAAAEGEEPLRGDAR